MHNVSCCRMGRPLGRGCLLLLVASLALGVGNAGGRTLATTTITVEVIGKGAVKSSSPNSGIKCGKGDTTCYLTFTSAGPITLTASPSDKWSFDSWSDDCPGTGVDDTCVLAAGGDYIATANFTGPATTTSTLSVSFDDTNVIRITAPTEIVHVS